MEFRLLGPFEVADGEQRLDLGPRKQQAVLAALALEAGRVVSLDRLIDDLWGEEPPPRATGTLQAYVSNLRRVLEPERSPRDPPRILVTRSPGYVLDVDRTAVDVARFEAAASDGRRLLDEGCPRAARERLSGALALWRGSALADFADEEFARSEVLRLDELRLNAIEDSLQADLDLRDHAAIVPELEKLIATHPLREGFWSLLMVALYRSERQADALRAYQQARTILGEELGIEPGPALRRLEGDILAQVPSLEWQAPPAEHRATSVPPSTLASPTPRNVDSSPLVGRQAELARLETILGTAATGRGTAVLVRGDAGIGKSRLAQEIAARARTGCVVAWGGSVEGGGTPAYRPWVEVVQSLLAASEADEARAALAHGASDLAQLVPEVKELTGAEPPTVAVDPETARLRLFESVAGFLVTLARQRTVVAVLDDLHWADAASLQLLGFLGPLLRPSGLVVLAAYRPSEIGPSHALHETLAVLSRHQVVERLDLEGLSEPEVGCLMAATMGAPAAPDVVSSVRARTEGNPFFVTELARLMAAGPDAGSAALSGSMPASVQDVVRHRLGRLPDQTNAVLGLAAVTGRNFDLAVLEAVVELDPERLLDLVEAAVMAGVVVEHPDTVGRFRFSHDVVRETILGGISALRRARLHDRIADALEALYREDEAHAVELAHHRYLAAPVSGDRVPIPYIVRAAEVATARLAHEQAEEQLRRALELIGRLPPGEERSRGQLDVLLRLNAVLAVTRGFADEEIGDVLSQARSLSSELDESEQVVCALFGLMLFHVVAGRYGPSAEVASQLLTIATESRRPPDLVAAHLAVGITAVQQGDLDTASRHFEQAQALDEGLHDSSLVSWFPMHPVICTSCFQAWAVWELGDRPRAFRLVEEALEFAVGTDHNLTIAHALDAATRIAVMDGDPGRARAHSERALKLRGTTSSPLYDAIHAVHHGWARAQLGETEEGIAELEQGLTAMESTGAWMLHTIFLALLAEAQQRAGRPHKALASIARAFEFVERIGEHFWESELHRLRGVMLLEAFPDQVDEARGELAQALAIAERRGARSLVERTAESMRRLP